MSKRLSPARVPLAVLGTDIPGCFDPSGEVRASCSHNTASSRIGIIDSAPTDALRILLSKPMAAILAKLETVRRRIPFRCVETLYWPLAGLHESCTFQEQFRIRSLPCFASRVKVVEPWSLAHACTVSKPRIRLQACGEWSALLSTSCMHSMVSNEHTSARLPQAS